MNYIKHNGKHVIVNKFSGKYRLIDLHEFGSLGDGWIMLTKPTWRKIYDMNWSHIGFTREIIDGVYTEPQMILLDEKDRPGV